MLDLNSALNRYDSLARKGREALEREIKARNIVSKMSAENKINNIWFDTDEFVADLEHFLNEALAPEKTYLYGEDLATGRKIEIKE